MSETLSIQQKSNLIDKYRQQISSIKEYDLEARYKIGNIFNDIKDRKLYLGYGEHIRSFNDLLEEPEFSIDGKKGRRSTVYNMMGIAKKLELDELKRIGSYERSVRLLPYLKENKEKIVEEVEGLPREAFEDYLRKLKNLTPTDECSHTNKDEYKVIKCRDCGKILEMKKVS